MKFFTDENFMHPAALLLQAFDHNNEIIPLVEYYKGRKGVPDTEWIGDVSQWDEKPIVVCGDGHILTRPIERKALVDAKLTFVHLARGWTNLEWNTFAYKIIRVWPAIRERSLSHVSPAVLEVTCQEKLRLYPLR